MKKQQFTNIRDIAKTTGVSIATVSRVINNPDSVSEEKRDIVLKAMNKYNYIPSQVAKNNFAQHSNTIMFLATDIGNPFINSLIKVMNDICFSRGYNLFTCNVGDDPKKERKYYEYCVANRCVGMVYAMGVSRSEESFKLKHDIPVVVIDGDVDISENYMKISSDPYMSMELLVEHLTLLGHERIGYIGSNELMACSHRRQKAFIDVMSKRYLVANPDYIYSADGLYECGREAFNVFFSNLKPPTAVIGVNDNISIGFMQEAQQHGIRIPSELSVCGIDGVTKEGFFPSLTTVIQNYAAIAEKAFDYISDPERPKGIVEIEEPVSLFVGESTGSLQKKTAAFNALQ